MPDAPDSRPPQPEKRKGGALVQGLKYTHIAFALPFGVIAGWLFGSLLDSWLGTTRLQFVGLGLGIVVGFYDLIRTYRQMSRDADNQ